MWRCRVWIADEAAPVARASESLVNAQIGVPNFAETLPSPAPASAPSARDDATIRVDVDHDGPEPLQFWRRARGAILIHTADLAAILKDRPILKVLIGRRGKAGGAKGERHGVVVFGATRRRALWCQPRLASRECSVDKS